MSGFLLALEGVDGSGTTTQAAHLEQYLKHKGRRVHRTAEPTKGPIGELLRRALSPQSDINEASVALLFAADRLDHLEREISPALDQGAVVITDRYLLSSLAYQGTRLPLDWVRTLNSRARRPDVSILLRVSPEVAAKRRQVRGGTTERFDDLERQRQVTRAYDQVFALPDVGPTYVIDAEPSVAAVSQTLETLIVPLLDR